MTDAQPSDLFEAILAAPDRDTCPGTRPIVSLHEEDEGGYARDVRAQAGEYFELRRRGVWHGTLVELAEPQRDPHGFPIEAQLAQRWHAAKPIVLPQALTRLHLLEEEIAERRRLPAKLTEAGGLARFLRSRRTTLAPEFVARGRSAKLRDPERDIECQLVSWSSDPERKNPILRDLWVKSAWLSTHEDDDSLRMRISFGSEVEDDASRDLSRHLRASELAERLLPECALVHQDARLPERIEALVGAPVFFSQHIAYWNGSEGGALFHHDAFDEDPVGGQLGVCYAQLSGCTLWLALSIEDLSERVIEFGEALQAGRMRWVLDQLFRRPRDRQRFFESLRHRKRLARELARPGCGSLGKLVNRGPEFTGLLADAGHAYVLRAGDVILLPNHGLGSTAMHSVFGAAPVPSYGLSMAIRERHPAEPDYEDSDSQDSTRP